MFCCACLFEQNKQQLKLCFAHKIQQLDIDSSNSFLCSFGISSLFINVPLAEAIQMCADTLYIGKLILLDYPKNIFIELMKTVTY